MASAKSCCSSKAPYRHGTTHIVMAAHHGLSRASLAGCFATTKLIHIMRRSNRSN
jgi:hypothetical protein